LRRSWRTRLRFIIMNLTRTVMAVTNIITTTTALRMPVSLATMGPDTGIRIIASTAIFTTSIADTRMVPSPRNSPVLTVGIRPCSGAILVLVFALAQGLFWAGIAATFVMGLGTAITVATIAIIAVSAKGLARRMTAGREGGGALLMHGLEFAAAGLVLLFGVGLLLGYIAAERVTCF
jgi:hypothetical protein